MKSLRKNYHFLAGLAIGLAVTAPIVANAQSSANKGGTAISDTTTVIEPRPAPNQWTPEKMRMAKPMPLPSLSAPPMQQATARAPAHGPSGTSAGGIGGPVHR